MESLLLAPLPPSRIRVASLVGSLMAHVAAVLLIGVVSRLLAPLPDEGLDWSRYRVEPLRLRLSEPIVFVAAPTATGNSRVRLPASHHAARPGPTILQPELPQQRLPLPASLPAMALWSRVARPEAPKPPAQDPVKPGRAEAPSPPPQLAAPPSLAAPNRELAAGDMNISLPPEPAPSSPALPMANRSAMPVQVAGASGARAASFDTAAGQPVNVMVLAENPSRARDVEIPKGVQNVPGGSQAGTPNARGSVQSAGGSPLLPLRADAALPVAPQSGARGSEPSPAPPPAARTAAPPAATRIEHPANGAFDVVIMQSATRDDLPPLGARLAGAPVYTVYLRVGDQKEWLLEYCAPATRSTPVNPYQVNVGDDGAITPPYPISTAIPAGFLGERLATQIVFHGLLTAAGALRDLRAAAGNRIAESVLTLLAEWRFRPAMRNRQPIDIEVLLIIPPHG